MIQGHQVDGSRVRDDHHCVERVLYAEVHGHGVLMRVPRANESLAQQVQRVISRAAVPKAVLFIGQFDSSGGYVNLTYPYGQSTETRRSSRHHRADTATGTPTDFLGLAIVTLECSALGLSELPGSLLPPSPSRCHCRRIWSSIATDARAAAISPFHQ